jgi:hypothetical protein
MRLNSRRAAWIALTAVLTLSLAVGCANDESDIVRGRGLADVSLPAASRAGVYAAAARAAFDLTDPSLSLLLDRRMLPRTIGLASSGLLSDAIAKDMRSSGVVQGTCEPPLKGVVGAPRCAAALPGYVLRFSPVFKAAGDTVEVYVFAQKYDNPKSGYSDPLRFERAYLVVPLSSGAWRAVKEGKIGKEIRGEGR